MIGRTAEPLAPGHVAPHALSLAEIAGVVESFASAAARADRAGFEVLEIHGAHGYLISSFLSPGVNRRNDAYGGDRAGRMRFALEVTRAVRAVWPARKPLFFRVSSVDGAPDGWAIEDSIALAGELGKAGVDVVDCSSGGMRGATAYENSSRRPGFQVAYASDIRKATGMKTMAVGHILDARQAEAVLAGGHADLTAIGRQAMYDPYWPHHAAQALGADPDFKGWNDQAGWWLAIRRRGLEKVGFGPDGRPLQVPDEAALA